jgi:hypothetical protein
MLRRALIASHGAFVALMVVAAVAIPAGAASADVSQTPVVTGCPAGVPLVNIQELETAQGHPYPLAEFLDQNPDQNGRGGNQNGFICAKPISAGETFAVCGPDCPVVLFLFVDDINPAQANAQAG